MGQGEAYVWKGQVTIPTYEPGEPEKNPMFFDGRVYQGSSGRIYPYPLTEKVGAVKTDKVYTALFLENEYLKVMLLPELGGRIWRAYDKTSGRDFAYHNHVVKPALAGLAGAWVQGGIEVGCFQRRCPASCLPVEYRVENGEEGSQSVLIHEVDRMYGAKALTRFTIYPGKAYIEVTGQIYNRTGLPQTVLMRTNSAVAANEHTQFVFPLDVCAVTDHGARDVSAFPLAAGIYAKKNYAPGTDISRYQNIPMPTSLAAEQSGYDFLGCYDSEAGAGILHIADHHTAPQKVLRTRGCGDFGQARERALTDADGPCVELTTGAFSDAQPGFAWLAPFEEKTYRQYVMPYKGVSQVKNATPDVVVGMEAAPERVTIRVYGTSRRQVRIVLTEGFDTRIEEDTELSPEEGCELVRECRIGDAALLRLSVYDMQTNALLLTYQPPKAAAPFPAPAEPVGKPEELSTNEELYLAGLQLERQRHAAYLPDAYYLEGLKRDAGDIRINSAYGALLFRRGDFSGAKPYLERALERVTRCGGACDGEAFYRLGLCELYLGEEERAREHFFKATWSDAQQEAGFYYLAALDARAGSFGEALEHVKKSLVKNARNEKACGLQAYLLRRLEQPSAALRCLKNNLLLDPFDFLSANERRLLGRSGEAELNALMRGSAENYLMTARDYAEFGAYEEAEELLARCPEQTPMTCYYRAYYLARRKRTYEAEELLRKAEELSPDYCFPNKPEDIAVLRYAIDAADGAMARYYLGCLFYDKLQRQQAIELWEAAAKRKPELAVVHRNLALAYYNVLHDKTAARLELETAFSLNEKDARVFLELDWIYKRLGMSFAKRLERYEKYFTLVESRDDLYIEYITLLNMAGRYERAHELTMQHRFHPWEGCEGKITAQYIRSLLEMANHALVAGDALQAERYLLHALVYPKNLGEGKPEGTMDNNIYYHIGLALELQEKYDEAGIYFKKAARGNVDPSDMAYCDDQPADTMLYQGLALLKLGEKEEAYRRFDRLISYGKAHLDDGAGRGEFALSTPEPAVFNEDGAVRNKAHCYYLMGLGYLGYGDMAKANASFAKAVELEPWNTNCRLYADV